MTKYEVIEVATGLTVMLNVEKIHCDMYISEKEYPEAFKVQEVTESES